MLTKIKKLLQDQKNRSLALALFAILLLTVAYEIDSVLAPRPTPSSDTKDLDPGTADTIIPKGFVLVPIDIQNIESLNSLVGPYSLVDLFTTASPNQKPGLKVGRKLRLLRAPLNPQSYAVLVPEQDAGTLMASQGPYLAVIQNPNQGGSSEVRKSTVQPAAITYLHRSKDVSSHSVN